MKWNTSRVLCEYLLSFYQAAIRLAMIYGTKFWVVKKQYIHKKV